MGCAPLMNERATQKYINDNLRNRYDISISQVTKVLGICNIGDLRESPARPGKKKLYDHKLFRVCEPHSTFHSSAHHWV